MDVFSHFNKLDRYLLTGLVLTKGVIHTTFNQIFFWIQNVMFVKVRKFLLLTFSDIYPNYNKITDPSLMTGKNKNEKRDQPAEYSTANTALIVYLLAAGNTGCGVLKRGEQN